MSDDLDDLNRALDAAIPAPDPTRKAADLALAMKNFDALQDRSAEPRPTSDRPKPGLFRGVLSMIHLTRRGALGASTAVAALAMVALIPVVQNAGRIVPQGAPVAVSGEAAQIRLAAPAADAPAAPAPAADAPTLDAQVQGGASPESGSIEHTFSQMRAGKLAPMPAPIMVEPVVTAPSTEAYPEAEPNGLRITAEEPVSTFSIDVDTASWAILRNGLNAGQLPDPDAVRIEEMVNYFPYDYPAPAGDAPFRASVGIEPTPWNPGTRILHIGLQGTLPAERPPLNLVFLVDTSGSMAQPNKLPLLKQSLRLLLTRLAPEDQVALITYAGSSERVLEPTPASDRDTILRALDGLEPGGGTAGEAGLEEAYAMARDMSAEGEVSRVLLATDGDFNIGLSDPDALERYIAKQRDSGTYLSVLGFGRGNLDDATMQALAQSGNGMAAYIDTLSEAQKVLVDQLSGALFPIADDVKIQIEFNPAQVAEYRLLGYETRALNREDFNNDKVDAGEIGAGHQVTALYEITPVDSAARLTDPLRYGTASDAANVSDEIGLLRLRYKAPGEETSQLIETPILPGAEPLPDAGFALAVAGFGELLRGADFLGDWSYSDAVALAQAHKGADPFGYRQEAITLMRLAETLSE